MLSTFFYWSQWNFLLWILYLKTSVLFFFSSFYFFVNRCYLSIDLQTIQYYLTEYAVHGFGFVEFKLPLDKALKDKRVRKKFHKIFGAQKAPFAVPFVRDTGFSCPHHCYHCNSATLTLTWHWNRARSKGKNKQWWLWVEGVPLARKRGILSGFLLSVPSTQFHDWDHP